VKILVNALPSSALAIVTAAILFGGLSFGSARVWLNPNWLLAIGVVFLVWSWRARNLAKVFEPTGWMAVLALYLFSDFCLRQYAFIQGSNRRLEIVSALLLCLGLNIRLNKKLLLVCAIAASLGAAGAFLIACDGRMIFSDDHPSFFYRLWLLRENFPQIPFYTPLWNGGIDARDFFPTGAHGVFLLYSPLIYFWKLEQIYNLIVACAVFILPAFLVGVAAWIHSRSLINGALSGLLAAAPSLYWYRWGLSYGTLGFLTAVSFVPLALVLYSRLLNERTLSGRNGAALFVATSLCVCWPLAVVALLPTVVLSLLDARNLLKDQAVRICFLGLMVLHLPWMVLFVRNSGVAKFVAGASVGSVESRQDPRVSAAERRSFEPIKTLRTQFAPINPVIGFCLLPALIGAWRARRRLEIVSFSWLMFLAVIASHWYPQLELERLTLVGLLLAAPLVSAWILSWLEGSSRLLRAIPLAVCLMVPLTSWRAANNRTIERYYPQAPYVQGFASAVRDGADGGRVLILGFTLHELSHGHLAPMPLFSGVPFLANSHVHDQWERRDVIPDAFRGRGDEGIEEYLKLFNVSLLAAHDKRWLSWLKERPTKFIALGQFGEFDLYRYVGFSKSYFYEGQGELLEQTDRGLRVRLGTPDVLLKFKYYPFLKASGCTLGSREVASGIQLIELRDCTPGQEVSVTSKPPWRRF